MTDPQRIESLLSDYSGQAFHIEYQVPIGGGCINDARALHGSGQSYFVKANSRSCLPAFVAEANALQELAATQTVRIPKVVAAFEGDSQAYLILEYIEPSHAKQADWPKLGRQLAQLHQIEKPFFGWTEDNVIGATPQPNPPTENWLSFFRDHRLRHQLELCARRGYDLQLAEPLLRELPRLLQDHQPQPSLLHGDLWSGNVSFAPGGAPFLYDPASYYGDREADLAFTEFFGGFPPSFYQAYETELPLASGYAERKILYNLYHCLNHLNLFGGGYAEQAEQMIQKLLSS